MFTLATLALAATLTAQPAAGYGALKGQITFSKAPDPVIVDVTTDKAHCTMNGPLKSNKVVVDPTTKGLKNVVVWLRPDTDNRRDRFPQDRIKPSLVKVAPVTHEVDQPCCEFVPRVLAVRAGDKIVFKNNSPVAHNINYSGEQAFNVTLPPSSSKAVPQPIAESNSITPFKCDIHPWMAGRMRVFDNPYFAKTDDKGNFEIKDAPLGKWRLVIWHEDGFHNGRAGILGLPVTIDKPVTEMKAVDFSFPK